MTQVGNTCMGRISFAYSYRCRWHVLDRATMGFVGDAGPEKLDTDSKAHKIQACGNGEG